MYHILFVCYGNICRSPMAEMIFKDIVIQNHKQFLFYCESKATSMEEIGNGLYPKAKDVLEKHNVTIEKHIASRIQKEEYEKFDLIIGMDSQNISTLKSFFQGDPKNKIHSLMSYTGREEEIEDPWYTDRFEKVYQLINEGCIALFNQLVTDYQNEANQ